ncbi:MAG: hypothetical protein DME72_06085 [Verrucomicrobia bacterium]|nr:MAG: hypothetical protein DME72_06085 [Verrucomicrobiota bacterium]
MKPDVTAVNLIGGIKPALTRHVNAPKPENDAKTKTGSKEGRLVSELHSIMDSILAAMKYRPTESDQKLSYAAPKPVFSTKIYA